MADRLIYRAVSPAEMADLIALGRLRPHPQGQSLEGKWFAASLPAAIAFGRRLLFGVEMQPFHIISVSVSDDLVDRMHHLPNLDMLGLSYFADAEILDEMHARRCIIDEVHAFLLEFS